MADETRKKPGVKICGLTIGGDDSTKKHTLKRSTAKKGRGLKASTPAEVNIPEGGSLATTIREWDFKKRGVGGVDAEEVSQFMASLAAKVEDMEAAVSAAPGTDPAVLTELERKVKELETTNAELARKAAAGGDEAIAEELKMARRIADEKKAQAEIEAKNVIEKAEEQARRLLVERQMEVEKLKDEVQKLSEMKVRFLTETKTVVDGFQETLKKYKG